jgi:hypothetical protein
MVVYFEGGQVLFDSGSIAFHEDCCCEAICDHCTGDTSSLNVDFTNVDTLECTECSTFYGSTFTLTRDATDKCKYEYTNSDWGCSGCTGAEVTSTHIVLEYILSGSDYILRCEVFELPCDTGAGVEVMVARFEYDFSTSKPTCNPSSPLSLSPVDTGFWNSNAACDWDDTVVTCSVSSV